MLAAGFLALACARSVLIWGFLGYAFGWPVLLVVMFLGVKEKRWEERFAALDEMQKKLEDKQKPEGYEEFNNVHDLFKQLENK